MDATYEYLLLYHVYFSFQRTKVQKKSHIRKRIGIILIFFFILGQIRATPSHFFRTYTLFPIQKSRPSGRSYTIHHIIIPSIHQSTLHHPLYTLHHTPYTIQDTPYTKTISSHYFVLCLVAGRPDGTGHK